MTMFWNKKSFCFSSIFLNLFRFFVNKTSGYAILRILLKKKIPITLYDLMLFEHSSNHEKSNSIATGYWNRVYISFKNECVTKVLFYK